MKSIAFPGNINIGKSSASGFTMNMVMNARSEMMPPINSHFQARAKPRSPMPNKANCTMMYMVIGSGFALLAPSIDSPINMIKAKPTNRALSMRATSRGVFIGSLEVVFIFPVSDYSADSALYILCLLLWNFTLVLKKTSNPFVAPLSGLWSRCYNLILNWW